MKQRELKHVQKMNLFQIKTKILTFNFSGFGIFLGTGAVVWDIPDAWGWKVPLPFPCCVAKIR